MLLLDITQWPQYNERVRDLLDFARGLIVYSYNAQQLLIERMSKLESLWKGREAQQTGNKRWLINKAYF